MLDLEVRLLLSKPVVSITGLSSERICNISSLTLLVAVAVNALIIGRLASFLTKDNIFR